MATDFETQIKLIAEAVGFDALNREVAKLGKSIDGLDSIKKVNQNAIKLGNTFKSVGRQLSIGISLPLAALGGIAIKTASDFEEAESKFSAVFSSIEKQAKEVANTFANDFGQSFGDAFELLGNTGDLLTGFGFTQEAALELSKQVNELAVDLTSFKNVAGGAEAASNALTKSLLGETESLKSLGVAIRQDDVQAKVEALEATGELTNETDRQKKAIATLALVFDQSKNAIGDYARTQESTANLLREIRNSFENFSATIGARLKPAFDLILKSGISLLNFLNNLNPAVIDFGLAFAGVVTVAGPIAFIIGSIKVALLTLSPAIITVGGTIAGLLASFGLLVSSLIALQNNIGILDAVIITFLEFGKTILKVFDDVLSVIDSLPGRLGIAIISIRETLQDIIGEQQKLIDNAVDRIIKRQNDANKKAITLGTSNGGGGNKTGNEEPEFLEPALTAIQRIREAEKKAFIEKQAELRKTKEELEKELTTLNKTGEILTNTFTSAFDSIISGTRSVGDAFKDLSRNIIRSLTNAVLQRAFSQIFTGLGFNQFQNAGIGGFASGGLVTGPGSGTSDSIPAFLSNGEFVLNAKSVAALGTNFLHGLNNMGKGFLPRRRGLGFQTGGEVSGSGGVVVNVINNSSNPVSAKASTRIDGRQIIIDAFLEDQANNGPMSQSIQNTFGVRR